MYLHLSPPKKIEFYVQHKMGCIFGKYIPVNIFKENEAKQTFRVKHPVQIKLTGQSEAKSFTIKRHADTDHIIEICTPLLDRDIEVTIDKPGLYVPLGIRVKKIESELYYTNVMNTKITEIIVFEGSLSEQIFHAFENERNQMYNQNKKLLDNVLVIIC